MIKAQVMGGTGTGQIPFIDIYIIIIYIRP